MRIRAHHLLPLCLFLPISEALGQGDSLKRLLTETATSKAREAVLGKRLEVKEAQFSGAIEAVDLEKSLQVKVDDFSLANDQARTTLSISATVRVEGKFDSDGSSQDISGTVSLTLTLKGKAKLTERQDKFFVQPSVDEMNLGALTITEISPKELSVAKGALEAAIKSAFKKRKDKLLEDVNASLPEQQLK
jgi:hypothetical protein